MKHGGGGGAVNYLLEERESGKQKHVSIKKLCHVTIVTLE